MKHAQLLLLLSDLGFSRNIFILHPTIMTKTTRPLFYIIPYDWTWWAWSITCALLLVGLFGNPDCFIAAMAITAGQAIILLFRDRQPAHFSVQVRAAYLLLLVISYPPSMRWLNWATMLGTFALVAFGYCPMARLLSLCPWNSREPYSWDRLRRTIFSAPDLERVQEADPATAGCAGGLCSIDAQVAPPRPHTLSSLIG